MFSKIKKSLTKTRKKEVKDEVREALKADVSGVYKEFLDVCEEMRQVYKGAKLTKKIKKQIFEIQNELIETINRENNIAELELEAKLRPIMIEYAKREIEVVKYAKREKQESTGTGSDADNDIPPVVEVESESAEQVIPIA